MNRPLSRYENIITQETDDEILIYDLLKNKAFCLNQTSATVWQECDGQKTVAEISQSVSKRLGAAVSEDIVWLALSQLKSNELLDQSHIVSNPFDGLTRREVVKRIGFASAVALPIISSVVAPTAVNAQSPAGPACSCTTTAGTRSRNNGCPCINDNDCCTNSCNVLIAGAFGICRAGTIPAGGASCCVAVTCGNQPGCPCLNGGGCATGVCTGNGICL